MARVLPAEWAPQDAALVAWPHADNGWPPEAARLEADFAAQARAISRFVPLVVACHDEDARASARACLRRAGLPPAGFATVIAPGCSVRIRDVTPVAVLDGGHPICIDCCARGPAGPRARGREFGQALLDAPGFATLGRERADVALVGGALETDGAGTLLVNRCAVLDPGPNPQLDADTLERRLQALFGIERTHWLDVEPLPGDDTGGAIDTLARFTPTGAIVHAAPGGNGDPATASLAALRAQLAERVGGGRRGARTLVPLPGPAPVRDPSGETRAAGYTGFVVLNGAVLVPAYGEPNDRLALARLRACFPARRIVPVAARRLAALGLSPHRLTVTWPHGSLQDLALA